MMRPRMFPFRTKVLVLALLAVAIGTILAERT
jgi:hypothetical protein